MIGISLSIATAVQGAVVINWSPNALFDSEPNGFWAGGLAPPAWTPIDVFGSGEDGIVFSDGFNPEDQQ